MALSIDNRLGCGGLVEGYRRQRTPDMADNFLGRSMRITSACGSSTPMHARIDQDVECEGDCATLTDWPRIYERFRDLPGWENASGPRRGLE